MNLDQALAQLARRLLGKRAFITGAASGIGREFAGILAAEGWSLGLNDVDEDALGTLSRELRASGFAVETYVFDVSDPDAFRAVADAFSASHGGADLVINAAGVGGGGLFAHYDLRWFQRVMDVNYQGTVNGSHAFLRGMLKANTGHIVNITSAAAYHGLPRLSAYCASKAAVTMVSETLSAELADTGIRVSVMACAFYDSNIWRHTLGSEAEREGARRLCEQAKLTARDAAVATLIGAAKLRFYIVLPGLATWIWRLKRWAPSLWLKVVPRLGRLVDRKFLIIAD